jgi:DNA-binding XRE family transcriptional regulator
VVDVDLAHLGRRVVAQGHLVRLRETLGLTPTGMAEILHTTTLTYRSWESNKVARLWDSTAERVGRFYLHAERQLDMLAEDGIDISGLMPLSIAAGLVGVSQSLLLKMYREDAIHAVDLGILGLWVDEHELDAIAMAL